MRRVRQVVGGAAGLLVNRRQHVRLGPPERLEPREERLGLLRVLDDGILRAPRLRLLGAPVQQQQHRPERVLHLRPVPPRHLRRRAGESELQFAPPAIQISDVVYEIAGARGRAVGGECRKRLAPPGENPELRRKDDPREQQQVLRPLSGAKRHHKCKHGSQIMWVERRLAPVVCLTACPAFRSLR